MKKIKNSLAIKIVSLFISIAFLCPDFAYSSDISHLRVPVIDGVRKEEVIELLKRAGRSDIYRSETECPTQEKLWKELIEQGKKIKETTPYETVIFTTIPFVRFRLINLKDEVVLGVNEPTFWGEKDVLILKDSIYELPKEAFTETKGTKLNVHKPSRPQMSEMLKVLCQIDNPNMSIISLGNMPEPSSGIFYEKGIRDAYIPIHNAIIGEIRKFLNNNPDIQYLRILDVGSGAGDLSERIRQEFRQVKVTSMDLHESTISMLKTRELRAYQSDARLLPHQDNTFDIVIASGLLNEIVINPEDFEPILKELSRVARCRIIITGLTPLIRDTKEPLSSAKQRFGRYGLKLVTQRLLNLLPQSSLIEFYVADKESSRDTIRGRLAGGLVSADIFALTIQSE